MSGGEIMVAYDGSPAARRALLDAADLAGRGGRVTVISVIPIQSISARLETVSDAARDRQRRLLGEAQTLLRRRDVEADVIEAAGDPLTEILAAADAAGTGTLVVGRDARRGPHLHRALADGLVRRARCDVLVVR
jgi:nucleotide-binding universal stress UspA family protein